MSNILHSTAVGAARKAGAVAGGAVAGGIPGAVAASALEAMLSKAKPDRLAAAGKLFTSPEFKAAVIEADAKGPAAAKLKSSPAFKAWAKLTGIQDADKWLATAMTAGAMQGTQQ